jgi:hypothetical protein
MSLVLSQESNRMSGVIPCNMLVTLSIHTKRNCAVLVQADTVSFGSAAGTG